MTMNVIPWILAAFAVGGMAALLASLRAGRLRAGALAQEAERTGAELVAARKQMEKAAAKQRRQAEELSELRRKLEKVRKRQSTGATEKSSSPSKGSQLEHELEAARQARDAARAEASGLATELSRLRAERAGEARAVPLLDNTQIESLQKRLEIVEQQAAASKAALLEAESIQAKLRKKVSNQEQLYVAIRGELQAKKDRLRAQQEEIERLQSFKVAVVDPLPAAAPPNGTVAEPPAD